MTQTEIMASFGKTTKEVLASGITFVRCGTSPRGLICVAVWNGFFTHCYGRGQGKTIDSCSASLEKDIVRRQRKKASPDESKEAVK